jgi:tetratricopeptide (TPR) repeat protein
VFLRDPPLPSPSPPAPRCSCMTHRDSLHDQGELKESTKLYRQVVKGQANRLEPTNPDLLLAQTNLAVMLREQGELEKARDLLEDVLEARKESLGLNHVDTLVRTT